MRPQQQNRRMRGRGNNRKGPNPLNRSYESNGPDVKIRGTAQQIADKYATLARDAQSAGDRVMAENYLQHAEHYNRIIAAAQAQMQPQQSFRDSQDSQEEADEGQDEQEAAPRSEGRQARRVEDGSGPQPVIDGIPAEVAMEAEGNRANGVKANGKANGHAPADAAAPAGEAAETAERPARRRGRTASAEAEGEAASPAGEAATAEEQEAPKPVKRVRRTRKKAASDTAEAGEGQPSEQAAAQG